MSDIIINKIILDKNITTDDTKNEIILKVINYLNPNKYKVLNIIIVGIIN